MITTIKIITSAAVALTIVLEFVTFARVTKMLWRLRR